MTQEQSAAGPPTARLVTGPTADSDNG